MKIDSTDTVSFSPLIQKDSLRVESGLFSFRGYGFVLALEPEGPPQSLHGVMLNGEDLGAGLLSADPFGAAVLPGRLINYFFFDEGICLDSSFLFVRERETVSTIAGFKLPPESHGRKRVIP
jgi:hypothetical protein